MLDSTAPPPASPDVPWDLLEAFRRTACRRASARYRCTLATPVHVSGSSLGYPRLGWVHNLSAEGIGLLLDLPLPGSAPGRIDLITPAGARATLVGRVAHTTRRDEGGWLVGCELFLALNSEQLGELL